MGPQHEAEAQVILRASVPPCESLVSRLSGLRLMTDDDYFTYVRVYWTLPVVSIISPVSLLPSSTT